MVSNLFLLVPLLVAASKVSEKHSALVDNIGTYPEEDKAYKLLITCSVALPFLVLVTWALDALLALAYLKWFHPWRIILQEEPDDWDRDNDAGNETGLVEN